MFWRTVTLWKVRRTAVMNEFKCVHCDNWIYKYIYQHRNKSANCKCELTMQHVKYYGTRLTQSFWYMRILMQSNRKTTHEQPQHHSIIRMILDEVSIIALLYWYYNWWPTRMIIIILQLIVDTLKLEKCLVAASN